MANLPEKDEHGQILCKECKKKYHLAKYQMCLDCANDLFGGEKWKEHKARMDSIFNK